MLAAFSSNPEKSTDEVGNPVEVVKEIGDVGESLSYVTTEDGTPAKVTTQYGTPAESLTPQDLNAEFPVDTNEPEGEIVEGNLLISSGSTPDETADVSRDQLELAFTSAVTDTTVSFTWAPDAAATQYTILRDGVVAGTTKDETFVDKGLEPQATYEYEIVGEAGESAEPVLSRYVPVTTLTSDPGESARIAEGKAALTYQQYNTAFIYKTFIQQASIPIDFLTSAGCHVDTSQRLDGDNRGFQSPGNAPNVTPAYRTMMFVNINWDNPAPYDIVWTKGVGPTKKYSASGALLETRYADSSKMVLQNPQHSGNYANFGISHEASDPFCNPVSAIRYSLTNVQLYRSGSVSLLGSRMPVPAHESYARFTNSSGSEVWRELYLGAQGSFNCTLPSVCQSESFNKTASY